MSCEQCVSVLTILSNNECRKCGSKFCDNCLHWKVGAYAGKCGLSQRFTTKSHSCNEHKAVK